MKQDVRFVAMMALLLGAAMPALADQKAPADAPDHSKEMNNTSAEEIRPTVKEALEHAKKAVEAGQKDDTQALVGHAEKAMAKTKQAQSAGLNEYLNGGAHELGEAIEHGRKNHTKDATEHMRRAIMRLSQAADLQVPQ